MEFVTALNVTTQDLEDFNLSQTIKNATEFSFVEFCCIFVNNEQV
jgi:hypothetical protein